MSIPSFKTRDAAGACAAAVLFALAVDAQTPPGGETQPSAPSSSAQPSYPSVESPRGTTPQQRQRHRNAPSDAGTTLCNQEDELARSECLRRDMTDDENLPAGVTRSMHQRRQQAQQRAEGTNVASEADTGSDQAGGRSRTRRAASDLPRPENPEAQQPDTTREPEPPETEANSAADTLGRER